MEIKVFGGNAAECGLRRFIVEFKLVQQTEDNTKRSLLNNQICGDTFWHTSVFFFIISPSIEANMLVTLI